MAVSNIWEETGLYRKFTQLVTGEEIWGANLALHGDPRFDSIRYVLNDFTNIDGYKIEKIDIDAIVVMDNAAAISKPVLKIAIVVNSGPFKELTLQYQEKMKGSPYLCEIFPNVDEARLWLSQSLC